MIVFNCIANIASCKTAIAIAFAHEIAGHLKASDDLDLTVLQPVGGNPQRISWSTRYKDLAALDALSQKLPTDKKYWELVGKASDNFIAGSMHDSIWRTL